MPSLRTGQHKMIQSQRTWNSERAPPTVDANSFGLSKERADDVLTLIVALATGSNSPELSKYYFHSAEVDRSKQTSQIG